MRIWLVPAERKPLYSHGLKNMLGLLKGLTDLPYGAAYGKTMHAGGLKEADVQYVYIENDNNRIKGSLFVVYFFFFLHNNSYNHIIYYNFISFI